MLEYGREVGRKILAFRADTVFERSSTASAAFRACANPAVTMPFNCVSWACIGEWVVVGERICPVTCPVWMRPFVNRGKTRIWGSVGGFENLRFCNELV